MSMRQRVGRQEIEHFLLQVGRTRQPGLLYLTGGAALVHRGIRPGQTLDIDIQMTIDPANLTAQIAQFPILGIDTDNGVEFINKEILAYCQR